MPVCRDGLAQNTAVTIFCNLWNIKFWLLQEEKVKLWANWLIRSRGILHVVARWEPWWMPGRTVMSPHRRHAITLRRFKVFIAQIKQNQVTRVGEVAPGDYNLLIKTKCNSHFFPEQKAKLILQLAYGTLMVILGIPDAGFLQRGMGLF